MSAPSAPFLEGCYTDSRYYEYYSSSSLNEPPLFSQDGTVSSGQLWMGPVSYDEAPNAVSRAFIEGRVSQAGSAPIILRWEFRKLRHFSARARVFFV